MKLPTTVTILLLLSVLSGAPFAAEPTAKLIPESQAAEILARLDVAWNAGDGKAFAAPFTDDADVINIFGQRIQGRAAIAERMQLIFNTIFKNSVHRERTLEMARHLSDDVLIVLSSAKVDVPAGPQAPGIQNRQTFILVQQQGEWRIRHWQNTPIVNQR